MRTLTERTGMDRMTARELRENADDVAGHDADTPGLAPEPTLTEMLAKQAARADRERAEYRRALAELAVLDEYDDRRRYRYGDYGAGQRDAELARRRGRVDTLRSLVDGSRGDEATRDELVVAFRRVALPRIRRLERTIERQAPYRRSDRPTRESLRAWRQLGAELSFDRSAHA